VAAVLCCFHKEKRKKEKARNTSPALSTSLSQQHHSYTDTAYNTTMDSKAASGTKKRFVRKVAPSKAPGRLLKKQLRNMERLLKNKDTLKDLPAEVVVETEKKIADVKKKIDALGPQAKPEAPSTTRAVSAQNNSKNGGGNSTTKGGIKATGNASTYSPDE
jgi:hypothetical protein